jgi:NADH dehydrogenase
VVADIDSDAQVIYAEDGTSIRYDVLVRPGGKTAEQVSIEGGIRHAFPVRDVFDALLLRSHVIDGLVESGPGPKMRHRRLSGVPRTVVVGGGTLGTRMAAVLSKPSFEAERRGLKWAGEKWAEEALAQVHLIEAGPELMPSCPPRLRRYMRRSLEKQGVNVHLGVRVEAVTERGIRTPTSALRADTIVSAGRMQARREAEALL